MVTHVTRQGIRDHTSRAEHTYGKGKFHNGFIKIIKDGNLRPPLGASLISEGQVFIEHLSQRSEEFQDDENYMIMSRTKAIDTLNNLISCDKIYNNDMAIHFAVESVADMYYGSETGNEIFIVYPAIMIASQFFSGDIVPGYEGDSDLYVHANSERGININAGIIFIPGRTRVNPKNGSRYEIDKNGNPIINQENINLLENFINSSDFDKFYQDLIDLEKNGLRVMSRDIALEIVGNKYNQDKHQDILDKCEPLINILKQYGINDIRLILSLLDTENKAIIKSWNALVKEYNGKVPKYFINPINNILGKMGILFIEAKETISSKEYWENYFDRNPLQKPLKIIYYDSSINPKRAFKEWKEKNGLDRKSSIDVIINHFGFPENKLDSIYDSRIKVGIENFYKLAINKINSYFDR